MTTVVSVVLALGVIAGLFTVLNLLIDRLPQRWDDRVRPWLFVLPAVLFTVAVVIFPTLFGFYIALTDWNLSAAAGPRFNGVANFVQLLNDPYFWNALLNMVF